MRLKVIRKQRLRLRGADLLRVQWASRVMPQQRRSSPVDTSPSTRAIVVNANIRQRRLLRNSLINADQDRVRSAQPLRLRLFICSIVYYTSRQPRDTPSSSLIPTVVQNSMSAPPPIAYRTWPQLEVLRSLNLSRTTVGRRVPLVVWGRIWLRSRLFQDPMIHEEPHHFDLFGFAVGAFNTLGLLGNFERALGKGFRLWAGFLFRPRRCGRSRSHGVGGYLYVEGARRTW